MRTETLHPKLGASQTIMLRLRYETRTAHEQIEQVPLLARLTAADYRLSEYQLLLSRLYGFYQPLEARLFSIAAPTADLQPKTPLLVTDLYSLGLTPAQLAALPCCDRLPPTDSAAQVMGNAYVLEGATLGGQLLRRQLLTRFGTSIHPALHFYSGYGEQHGQHWRQFGARMAQHYDTAETVVQDQVITAAAATFATLHAWLMQAL